MAAAQWLKARSDATGKLGAVGFCYGGGIVHRLALRLPALDAGVPFYGNTPSPEEASKVKAPLLVQQADVDERINAAWPAYEAALKAAGADYVLHRYAGTQHGFHNDTTPRYDAAAAALAWGRTMAFLTVRLQAGPASASSAPAVPSVRLRGRLASVAPDRLVLKTREGEVVDLALGAGLVVTEVYPIELSALRAGSYIGVGATPQADGSQRAIAVTVFPESARGTAEGHRPFDLAPQSTMTNATVANLAAAPEGRRLQLAYKEGQQTIVVPPGTPIVSFRPADRSLLVSGASVSLTAQVLEGKPTVQRINAGRDGFALPY